MFKSTDDSALSLAALVFVSSSFLPGHAALAEESGTIFVGLDMNEAYLAEIDQSVWVIQEFSDELPLALSAPAGPGGLQIPTVSALTPPLSAAFFAEGTTSATVVESVASIPFVEFTPGWLARGGYFAINFTSLPPGVEMTDPTVAQVVQVVELGTPARGNLKCMTCTAMEALCYYVFGDSPRCDPENICTPIPEESNERVGGFVPARRTSDRAPMDSITSTSKHAPRGDLDFGFIDVLRRYRDEILASTPEGTFYIELYASSSLEMLRATFRSPSLLARFYRAANEWAPAFQALVDGTGDGFVISQQMEDNLLALFDTYESVGSPDFAQAIAYERARLQLDQIAGLTMTEYQTQIETLGGVSAVESTSWGRVKALYR